MNKNCLSLYVHIPFCVKKCEYCDFLSAPADHEVKERYTQALLAEIEKEAALYRDYTVQTVFFGGGTPTCLNLAQLEEILCKLKTCFHFGKQVETSIECNPGTVLEEGFYQLREMGFNRVSFGLQSSRMEELKLLGRIHSYEQFLDAYQWAREAGFENINVDIMSALPRQTLAQYLETVEKVAALGPEHISSYSLIIEEKTPFYERYHEADEQRIKRGMDKNHILPSEDEERSMYEATREILCRYGYQRYEISNYAKPHFACKHNLVYWTLGNYLGLGLGASSMVNQCRWQQTEDMTEYLEHKFVSATHQQRVQERMEEYMFLGLRRTDGISKKEFEVLFGLPIESVYGEIIERYEKLGFLLCHKDRVALSEKGIHVSNVILAEFLLS